MGCFPEKQLPLHRLSELVLRGKESCSLDNEGCGDEDEYHGF